MRGASTALVPCRPSSGVSSSVATTRSTPESRSTTAGRPMRASCGAPARASPPRARADAGPAPSAASIPAPASFVAPPPTPRTTLSAPSAIAASTSRPTPHVLVRAGSRSSAPRRWMPVACEASTKAVRRPSRSTRRTAAGTSRPRGSLTVVATVVPPSARARTSRKPGPPSDSGSSSTSSWGAPACQPSPIAVAACTGPSEDPKESGAMRTRTRRGYRPRGCRWRPAVGRRG